MAKGNRFKAGILRGDGKLAGLFDTRCTSCGRQVSSVAHCDPVNSLGLWNREVAGGASLHPP